MKKLLSLLLSTALLSGLAVPALAADVDDRLAQVTQVVKDTLDLDTQDYTQFYGDVSHYQLVPLWSLSWSSPEENLDITATESGRIVDYNRSLPSSDQVEGLLPAFPALTQADAHAVASDFLTQVLDSSTESSTFNMRYTPSVYDDTYYFSGDILLHNLPAPLTFSLRVDVASGCVTAFHRTVLDNQFLGGIPSPSQVTPTQQATTALLGEQSLYPEYVTDEDGTAVLRYLPHRTDDFYVDDATGELVNLSQLSETLFKEKFGAEDAVASESEDSNSSDGGLTSAEQSGVDTLSDVLSQADLEAAVAAIAPLGLEEFTLTATTYQVERPQEGDTNSAQVWAKLTYNKQSGYDSWRTTVTLDAKTGALEGISGYTPYQDTGDFLTYDQALAEVEDFLSAYLGDAFAQTALYTRPTLEIIPTNEAPNARYSFTFARIQEGIFYPEQSIHVTIDGDTGHIFRLSQSIAPVTFDTTQGLISPEAAQAAYAATFDTQLGYVAVPQSIDLAGNDLMPLLEEMGRSYFYTLKLGHTLVSNQEGWFRGIDGKTACPVTVPDTQESLTYSDLDGHWVAPAATKLASYHIGWQGGTLSPAAPLTQLNFVTLLVALHNGAPSPQEDADDVYRIAAAYDLFPQGLRQDDAPLTRMDALRILLDSQGLGQVAQLEGIYRCDFTDAAAIPAADLGYAALAQGLGIAHGDAQGNLNPTAPATRADAIALLYQLLEG